MMSHKQIDLTDSEVKTHWFDRQWSEDKLIWQTMKWRQSELFPGWHEVILPPSKTDPGEQEDKDSDPEVHDCCPKHSAIYYAVGNLTKHKQKSVIWAGQESADFIVYHTCIINVMATQAQSHS